MGKGKTDKKKLKKLVEYISTILRRKRGQKGGIYIDYEDNISKALLETNTVVYGRRGSGKTTLADEVEKRARERGILPVYIDCEKYKHLSYPDVLIKILLRLLNNAKGAGTKKRLFFFEKKVLPSSTTKAAKLIENRLNGLLEEQESWDLKLVEEYFRRSSAGVVGEVGPPGTIPATIRGGIGGEESSKVTKARDIVFSKIDELFKKQEDYEGVLTEIIKALGYNSLFVILDDYYHLKRENQPLVVDYLHIFSKTAPIYFKMTTIRQISTLIREVYENPIGVQEFHDYQPINLDFSLERYDRTKDFMRRLLKELGKKVGINKTGEIFRGEGFERVVLGSGGVPRDFLNILSEAFKRTGYEAIGKDDIRQVAGTIYQEKGNDLAKDAGARSGLILQANQIIKDFCTKDKCKTGFLVSREEMTALDQEFGLLEALMNFRYIHIIKTSETSKTKRGTYNAYVIDIGSYSEMRKLKTSRGELLDEIDIEDIEVIRNLPVFSLASFTPLTGCAPT